MRRRMSIGFGVPCLNLTYFTGVFFLFLVPCKYSRTDSSLVAAHDLLLAYAAANSGEQGQTQDGDGERDFLVAGNGGTGNKMADLALGVQDGAAIALGADADATKGHEARRRGLAAALDIAAAKSGLSVIEHDVSS